ncbi:TetR/AcrR family transcriptional regulator [Amycolatopsis sp. NPDC021455]|uniref:TetR/AcrR family transcriptional regulator n=1 Tax=Amycolatopsis sp. NPDC021455 TaxID=3154901 RepID=UPI0033F468A7
MTEPSPPSRQQLVAGAADMIRRRGLNATSIREVAKHAGTPLGSTYHYFPGGKQQLATEAVRFAGDTVTRMLDKRLRAGPVDGLRAFLALWREILTGSDFQAGCPVLAVSIEEGTHGEALSAAAEAFTGWEAQLTGSLREHGVAAAEAGRLATLAVAAAEGAVAMCRAQRSTRPLDRVSAQLESLITTAVGG